MSFLRAPTLPNTPAVRLPAQDALRGPGVYRHLRRSFASKSQNDLARLLLYDVSAMPINLKYVLVCDEVRQEINKKFIVIGLYTPDLSIPQIPFVMPSLTFFVCLESDRVLGMRHFTVRIEQLDSGRAIVEGMGALQFATPGIAVAPVRFGNLQFNAAGQYMFSMTIDGEAQPITTPFGVILNIPVPPQSTG